MFSKITFPICDRCINIIEASCEVSVDSETGSAAFLNVYILCYQEASKPKEGSEVSEKQHHSSVEQRVQISVVSF